MVWPDGIAGGMQKWMFTKASLSNARIIAEPGSVRVRRTAKRPAGSLGGSGGALFPVRFHDHE